MASEQTLRVKVIGDTTGASQAFRGFTRDAEMMSTGFGRVAGKVGFHADDMKRTVRGLRRVARTAFGGAGGIAGSIGQSALAGSDLGVVLSALPFGPVAGVALGLAAVIWKLRDGESAAAHQARKLAEAHDAVRVAVAGAAAAAVDAKQGDVDVLQNQSKLEDATKALAVARTHLTEVDVGAGRGSQAYVDAQRAAHEAEVKAETSSVRLASARVKLQAATAAHGKSSSQYREALVGVDRAEITSQTSTRALADARQKLDVVVNGAGKGSREYRDALAGVVAAEAAAMRAADARIQSQVALAAKSEKHSAAIDKEVDALRKQKEGLAAAVLVARTLGTGADHLADTQAKLSTVTEQLDSHLANQAKRHRDVGRAAAEMAGHLQGTGRQTENLRKRLKDLAAQEIEKANKIDALNAIGAAAAGAAGKVGNLINQIRLANAAKIPGINAAPADRRGGGGKVAHEFRGVVARNRPGVSIADAAAASLTGLGLNDSLQDKQTRATGETAAQTGGATNPENIRLQGELAVTNRQIKENKQRQDVVTGALRRVRRVITKTIIKRDGLFASLRKTHNKKARDHIQQKIEAVRSTLSSLYDDERGLISEAASLAAEAAELGFDAAALVNEISATPAVLTVDSGSISADAAPADSGPSAADVEAALAGTTPGTADDLAAAQNQLSDANAALAAARAGGDPQTIINAANRVSSLQQTISGFAASGTSTTTSTGSTTTNAVNEITMNIYPSGAAADDPRALLAAAAWQFRRAV